MDACGDPAVGEVQRLQDTAWQAIGTATVDRAEQNQSWKVWTEHNRSLYGTDAAEHKQVNTDKLLTFAVAVREGKYGLGSLVKVQSVKRALRHVTQKFVLDGRPVPRKSFPAQQSLDLSISRLIKSYWDSDPPPEPKLALPISTITAIAKNYRWSPHLEAVADLVTIAFFYLLRVREYTYPSSPGDKRTIPLQLCDVKLWRRGTLLPHTASLATLLSADSATICIANTKNGTKGAVVHHEAFGGPICPVAALARRIANIQQGPRTGTIDMVCHKSGCTSKVSDRDIGIAMRWGATYDGLLLKGYTLNRISSHEGPWP